MIKGVLFDLGATLLYTPQRRSWAAVVEHMHADLAAALQATGYAVDPADFINRFAARLSEFDQQGQTDWVEYTTSWVLNTTLQEMGAPALTPEAAAQVLAAYHRYSESLCEVAPGAHPVLEGLAAAGMRLGLISNGSDSGGAFRLLDRLDLRRFFDPVLHSAIVGVRKPNPEIFRLALAAWGLPPQACAMVGDTLGADILGAQLAGLHNVWFSAYADSPANRAHQGNIIPEAEIERLADLPAVLAQW